MELNLDFIMRLGLGTMYLALAVRSFTLLRGCITMRSRRISAAVIGIVALLWAVLWLYFAVALPHIEGTRAVGVGVWFSRVIHFPQLGGMYLMLALICTSERAKI